MNRNLCMLVVAAALILSCSKKSSGDTVPIVPPPPPPPIPADTFTKITANRYMVDSNATKETVALFYNMKTMSKSGFAVGQQDAFTNFYNNIGGQSDRQI